MADNSSHEAEAFLSLLWRHIYTRVRAWVFPHHFEHEPAGNDPVSLPLGFLRDVYVAGAANGDALTYESATKHWIPGVGGGGKHAVHFGVALPAVIIPPGPTNITGETLKIYAVQSTTDDSTVAGTLSIPSVSVPTGRIDYEDGSEPTWSDGQTITLSLSNIGYDGTYLTIDIAAG